MSGPLSFRITDRLSLRGPPAVAKEWTDTVMLVFDFTSWLGPDQNLAAVSDVFFQTSPQVQAGVWTVFPGCCSNNDNTEPPEDVNPLSLAGVALLPGGKKIELSLGAGTPGLSYLASFIATAAPYARRKEVGAVVTCFAMRPLPVEPTPPIVLPPVLDVTNTVVLPVGTTGTINVNNQSGAVIIITLPSTPFVDQVLYFKDVAGNAGTWPITIQGAAGATVDNQPAFYLFADYQAAELYWTGSDWGVR